MNFLEFIQNHENGNLLIKLKEDETYLRRAGFLGYFIGIFTLFISFKVLKIIPGELFSFIFFFAIVIILNYLFASLTNLFMDMIGYKQSASDLFYYFGIANFVWIVALPFSFISQAISSSFSLFYSILLTSLILFKLKLIKILYGVRYKLALISFLIPYILITFLLIGGSGYFLYWLIEVIV